MAEGTPEIEILDIYIAGIPNKHVVAKVQRISSPPVAYDAVSDPRACALMRLADVFRGGPRTRAYADFCDLKLRSKEVPDIEWEGYVAEVCTALGVKRLPSLELAELPDADSGTTPTVTYHMATLKGRDYVVARTGTVLGGPAACGLLADPAISALDRLADVLCTGESSQCFNDFGAGRPAADGLSDWKLHGAAVKAERASRKSVGADRTEWIRNLPVIGGALYRYDRRSRSDILRPGVVLSTGEVVRAMDEQALSPFGESVVRIVDRDTGAELGLVAVTSLRPL